MQIHISDKQTDLPIDPSGIEKIVRTVLDTLNESCDELGVSFVSAQEISQIHATYFDDDSITDCISFPIEKKEGYCVLGDIFICPLVAIQYAKEHPEGLSPHEETTLYLVHGLLHLLGFDDIKKRDQALMYSTQEKLLFQLKEKALCLKAPNEKIEKNPKFD